MAARVLLIEDDSRLAGMVETYLGEAGYVVARAPDGRSGVERHRDGGFDAVVLNGTFSDIDGSGTAADIRTLRRHPI